MNNENKNIDVDIEKNKNKSETQHTSLLEDLLPHLHTLYTKKKIILITIGIIAILTFIILWFIVPSSYEVTVTILPESTPSTSISQLSNIASLAGISLGSSSISIYANLVLSEAVLEPVIMDRYRIPGEKDSSDLIGIFKITPNEDYTLPIQKRDQFNRCFEILTENGGIIPEMDETIGTLSIIVTMPSSKLATEVANNVIKSLDDYVKNKKQSTARNVRIYLEGRVKSIGDSLFTVEEKLNRFNLQNRLITQSPELVLEQNRLQRDVVVYSSTLSTLRTQLESAKLEEIKNIPIVNIREWAKEPVTASGPRRPIFFILIMGFSLAVICVLILFKQRILNSINIVRGKVK